MTTTRLCKYHGRACEFPGRCLNHSPRKYEGDGHLEDIDPERLTVGVIIRHPYQDGGVSSFSDCVVTGIYTKSWKDPAERAKHHDNLLSAREAATHTDNVVVKLSRPYLYAHNLFGTMPNWLVGVETFEAGGNNITYIYKVVVQSTGAYSTYNNITPPPPEEAKEANADVHKSA